MLTLTNITETMFKCIWRKLKSTGRHSVLGVGSIFGQAYLLITISLLTRTNKNLVRIR